MPTIYEVTVKANQQGQDLINVFHVRDGDDLAVLSTIADIFRTHFVVPLKAQQSNTVLYESITVKSLTAVNPGVYVLPLTDEGASAGDSLPTGVHIFVKLLSQDPSFRAGGKLIGGFVETQFTSGEPENSVLDAVENILAGLIIQLVIGAAVNLFIYRPSLSLPGIPVGSIVDAVLARGGSTNNRRRKDFKR